MKLDKENLSERDHALLHEIAGTINALAPNPAVGTHKLGGLAVTFYMPESAFVTRAEGTAGGGFDHGKAVSLELSRNAVLLFLEKVLSLTKLTPSQKREIWLDVIRNSEKGLTAAIPEEAVQALVVVESELPKVEPKPRKTAAKRTGEKEVEIEVAKIPAAKKPPKKKVA